MPRGKAGVPPEDPKDLQPEAIDPALDQHAQDIAREVAEQVEAGDGDIIDAENTEDAGEWDDSEPAHLGPQEFKGEVRVHAPIEFAREFRRHKRTGQIFAIELAGGQLNAARELVRPEEMTHGALPVLTLYVGEPVEQYREAAGWCEPWEPKHTPESALKRMAALEEEVQTLDKKIDDLGRRKAKLGKDREQKIAEIRRLIQQARAGQLDLLDGVPVVGGGPTEQPPAEEPAEDVAAEPVAEAVEESAPAEPAQAEEAVAATLPA